MTQATLLLAALAAGLLWAAWRRGDGSASRGVRLGWQTLKRTAALLVVAFIIVGFVNALEPQDLVQGWMGPQSGGSGVLLGTLAGMLLPGGPYVVFPLIAALYSAGAGLGPTLAMITSWASLGLLSVSFELPFLGWRFSLIRLGIGAAVPIFVGLLSAALFGA